MLFYDSEIQILTVHGNFVIKDRFIVCQSKMYLIYLNCKDHFLLFFNYVNLRCMHANLRNT